MSLWSSSKQYTELTDKSANAGDGSVVAGGNLTITTSDPQTTTAALDANAKATAAALDSNATATNSALGANVAAVGRALSSVDNAERESTTRFMGALEAVQVSGQTAARTEQSVLDAAQRAIDTTSGLAQSLVTQVADSKKDPNNKTIETLSKYGATAAALIAAAVAAYFIFRKRE